MRLPALHSSTLAFGLASGWALAGPIACDADGEKPVAPGEASEAAVATGAADGAASKGAEADKEPKPDGDPKVARPIERTPGPFAVPAVAASEGKVERPAPNPGQYESWAQRAKIYVAQSHVDTAWLTEDGSHLIVRSGAEGSVRIYGTAKRKLRGNFEVDGFSAGRFERGMVLPWRGAEGSSSFLVVNEKGIKRYALADGKLLDTLDDREHWDARWTEDGRFLFAVASDLPTQSSTIHVFERTEAEALVERAEIQSQFRADEIAVSHDNRLFAMVTYPADELVVAELASGDIRWKQPLPKYAGTVDFSPQDDKVAVGGSEVVIFDVADPKRQARYTDFGNNVHRVRFSPSGDALAVAVYDGAARLLGTGLDKPQLPLLATLKHGRTANVYAVTWLPDGSGIWTSSGDKTVRLWGAK